LLAEAARYADANISQMRSPDHEIPLPVALGRAKDRAAGSVPMSSLSREQAGAAGGRGAMRTRKSPDGWKNFHPNVREVREPAVHSKPAPPAARTVRYAWRRPGCLSSGGPAVATTAGPTATGSAAEGRRQPQRVLRRRYALSIRASGRSVSRPAKSCARPALRQRFHLSAVIAAVAAAPGWIRGIRCQILLGGSSTS